MSPIATLMQNCLNFDAKTQRRCRGVSLNSIGAMLDCLLTGGYCWDFISKNKDIDYVKISPDFYKSFAYYLCN